MTTVPRDGGASTCVLAASDIRDLHDASLSSKVAPLAVLRIATLIPCDAAAIAAARIEDIDRELGLLRLSTPSGTMAEVALGMDAAAAVSAAAGARTEGPLVIDAYGDALTIDADTLDYARELAADGIVRTPSGWTFEAIRNAMFEDMLEFGMTLEIATAQAGLGTEVLEGNARLTRLHSQRGGADWWTYRLGLPPASPFRMLAAYGREGRFGDLWKYRPDKGYWS